MKKGIGVTIFFLLFFFVSNGQWAWPEVEEMPQFPGGEDSLQMYILRNLKYPENVKKDGMSGTVYVTFTVDENGKVINVKAIRGLSTELDAEAVRVVSNMPSWKPGKQGGKPIPFQYNYPVRFKL